jgi:hypothetical protein
MISDIVLAIRQYENSETKDIEKLSKYSSIR